VRERNLRREQMSCRDGRECVNRWSDMEWDHVEDNTDGWRGKCKSNDEDHIEHVHCTAPMTKVCQVWLTTSNQ